MWPSTTAILELNSPTTNFTTESPFATNVTNPDDTILNLQDADTLINRTMRWLEEYVATSMFFIGVIGNIMIFTVFSMKGYRSSVTALLYRTLAVADGTVVALYDGLHTLPAKVAQKSLFSHNTVTCKMLASVYCWFRAFAAWVLVLIAVERVIGVMLPHKARIICTKRLFGWLIFGTCVVLLGFYAPLVFSTEHVVIYADGVYRYSACSLALPGSPLEWYGIYFFTWMNLLFTSVLPFTFIITFNILIIYGLRRARMSVNAASSNTGQSGSNLNQAVAILMSISVTSIILTLPYPIYFALESIYREQGINSHVYSQVLLLGVIAPVCDSMNHSINIVLYCLCGKKFRSQLKLLLCCSCAKPRRTPAPNALRSPPTGTCATVTHDQLHQHGPHKNDSFTETPISLHEI